MSDTGGLTQFGAFVEELPPGSASALVHWHAHEDEMVYALSGRMTVVDGDETYELLPGEAAVFPAGAAKGHCVRNLSGAPVRYMVIGTRSDGDVVTYPDHDRVLTFERAPDGTMTRQYTALDGAPAEKP